MSETVALNKKRQSKFAKKAAKLKSKVEKGEIKIQEEAAKPVAKRRGNPRGLVYLGHIPHGFYEEEMRDYFKQFGRVTNVRVCRSFKTGKSKGFGFVEFLVPEVAEIAAETMHNYLMFNRRLEAKYIPPEKQNPNIFKGEGWSEKKTPYKTQNKNAMKKRNLNVPPKKKIAKVKQQLGKLNSTMNKLKVLGISHEIQPVDVPTEIKLSTTEEPKKTKKTAAKRAVRSKKINSGFVSEADTSIEGSPKKKNSGFISEPDLDTSVDSPKKPKRVVKKKSSVLMKKMSDKLKMATMSVLDSDLVVKKKGKIEKKVTTKKVIKKRK